MSQTVLIPSILIFSYLLGSINFTVILFKLLKFDDPRISFSGNPGTTNVYRIAGPFWASLVLILDIGRAGLVALLALEFLSLEVVAFAGFFLILGNRFPCFHGFKGGKGVANYMGFVIFIIPVWGLVVTFFWPIIYKMIKVTFIPSFIVIALMGAGMVSHAGYSPMGLTATAATVALIFYGHKKNILEWLKQQKKT